MPDGRRFYRVFHDTLHTVQYTAISEADGYVVTRWVASEGNVPATVAAFKWRDYGENWAACREAATAYARSQALGKAHGQGARS